MTLFHLDLGAKTNDQNMAVRYKGRGDYIAPRKTIWQRRSQCRNSHWVKKRLGLRGDGVLPEGRLYRELADGKIS